MSSNTARLTIYYLISSFEVDFRRSIGSFLAGTEVASIILPKEMFEKISARFLADGMSPSEVENLDNVLDYLDFGDLIQLFRKHIKLFPQELQDVVRVHQSKFDELIPIRNRTMHGRPLEFDDLAKTLDLVEELVRFPAFWPDLRRAATDISSRPEILFGVSVPLIAESERISHNLPMPDFDETGFIGRRESVRQVAAAIRGVYPVITIVGEGGLGKTSLALKAAYDLLDDSGTPFDAIIFTSAKTSQLTVTDIKRIEGAITSSVGLMGAAVAALSGSSESPVEDLIVLMQQFRVLLILDNLETVIDENVRVLARSMPVGSKLLITSRIGLGAFEFPIVLQGLSAPEATQLLRASAKASGVQRLCQMHDDRLRRYCEKMRCNPLHIKWFVSAVRAGKRPEEILADERLFLKFCLSNVYEQLSESARKVVRTLLSVGGANTTSELAYLSDLDESSIVQAVQELLKTNIFIASSTPISSTFKTRYELSLLSRSYLSRFYPVAKEEQERLTRRKRQLVSFGEQLIAESKKNPLSPYLIHCRDKSDAVPAKHLSDALRHQRLGDVDAAYESVDKARVLSPEFYEVARVEAWLYAQSGSVSEAQDAYERALELAPDEGHVSFFYGGFLLYSVNDVDLAMPHFERSHELLPGHPEPIMELARCYLYAKRYDEVVTLLDGVGDESALSERMRRKARDVRMQVHQRWAEDQILELAYIEALTSLEKLREVCSSIEFLDQRMRRRIQSTLPTMSMVRAGVEGNDALEDRIEAYAVWLSLVAGNSSGSDDPEGAVHAKFLRLAGSEKFGFAVTDDGTELFIHETQFLDGRMSTLLQGDALRLTVSQDSLGRWRGENVRRV